MYLSLLQKKRVTISDYSFVAGTGFIAPRCFAMGQRGEQPKENKKRTTLLGIFWASLKVETRFTFKSTKNLLISQEVFFVAGTGLEPVTFGL